MWRPIKHQRCHRSNAHFLFFGLWVTVVLARHSRAHKTDEDIISYTLVNEPLRKYSLGPLRNRVFTTMVHMIISSDGNWTEMDRTASTCLETFETHSVSFFFFRLFPLILSLSFSPSPSLPLLLSLSLCFLRLPVFLYLTLSLIHSFSHSLFPLELIISQQLLNNQSL